MFIHFPGNEEVKKVLIDHGADLNARDSNNLTPRELISCNFTINLQFKVVFLKLK